MTRRPLASALAGLAALTAAGGALAQTPYGPSAYGSAQTRTPADALSSLLGSLFGVGVGAETQVLEDDWNRGGQPLSNRRADLGARIEAGVRDGSLSRFEADQLRNEYDALARIEASYSADGRITTAERQDLRDRYQSFSQRLRAQRADDDGGRWQPLSLRRAQFEAQVNTSLQQRDITRAEATRLRADYQALAQLEANYGRNGLDAREIADLTSRYDDLERRLGVDDQYGGAGRWTSLDARVTAAERAGRLDRDDSAMLRAQLADLTRLEAAYQTGGVTVDERSYLDRRYSEVFARVQVAAR